jgi:hypothetical protein
LPSPRQPRFGWIERRNGLDFDALIGRTRHFIALAFPLALAACSSASERFTTELVSPPPPNYREIITTRARAVFPDPTAIRETTISAHPSRVDLP